MASSRLLRVGTIFSRVTGLIRSGAMREEDRPLWYDIYAAHPPRSEPREDRQYENKPVVNILYKEDIVRAMFYKDFGCPDTLRLEDRSPSLCQRLVLKYQELEAADPSTDPEELYRRAAQALNLQSDSDFTKGQVQHGSVSQQVVSNRTEEHESTPPLVTSSEKADA